MHLRYRDMDLGAYVDLDEVRNMVSVYLSIYLRGFFFVFILSIHSFVHLVR